MERIIKFRETGLTSHKLYETIKKSRGEKQCIPSLKNFVIRFEKILLSPVVSIVFSFCRESSYMLNKKKTVVI